MNREAIYSALFARLQNAYEWATASRILEHWSDVPSIQQPAMFLTQVNEQAITQTRQPTRWMLSAKVYLYAHSQTQNGVPPSIILNNLLDAITNAMKPENAVKEVQDLGGLVEYARIEGVIETDEGLLGEQAVAIIPISILTAN